MKHSSTAAPARHAWALPPQQFGSRMHDFLPYEHQQRKHHRQHRRQHNQPTAVRRASQPASRSSYRQPLSTDPRTAAHALVLQHGWSETEWSCLDQLWMRESGWNTYAANPSGAYGIPQALPGSKMASFGSDWQTNPVTQIQWGLWYIATSYGTPCAALSHENSAGYY